LGKPRDIKEGVVQLFQTQKTKTRRSTLGIRISQNPDSKCGRYQGKHEEFVHKQGEMESHEFRSGDAVKKRLADKKKE